MVEGVTVRDVMTREYLGVSESDTVHDAVDLLLRDGATNLVVVRGTKPVGLVPERALLSFVVSDDDPKETAISEVMSDPAPVVSPNRDLTDAATLLSAQDHQLALVTEDEELLGVLTERDILTAVSSLLATASHTDSIEDEYVGFGDEEEESGEFSTQSVCEICGSLTPDLQNFNGQLVCSDCRSM